MLTCTLYSLYLHPAVRLPFPVVLTATCYAFCHTAGNQQLREEHEIRLAAINWVLQRHGNGAVAPLDVNDSGAMQRRGGRRAEPGISFYP